eukprot:1162136-Pelagomonas_calceolata.AAC.13
MSYLVSADVLLGALAAAFVPTPLLRHLQLPLCLLLCQFKDSLTSVMLHMAHLLRPLRKTELSYESHTSSYVGQPTLQRGKSKQLLNKVCQTTSLVINPALGQQQGIKLVSPNAWLSVLFMLHHSDGAQDLKAAATRVAAHVEILLFKAALACKIAKPCDKACFDSCQ